MPQEIERKFLLRNDDWKSQVANCSHCKQGYLCTDGGNTIRVRIMGSKGYITIKSNETGISRKEYEYEIPHEDAEELFSSCECSVSKVRHIVYYGYGDKKWEIDVFDGDNNGLVLAEIELESEDEDIVFPSWIGKEVSAEGKYYNSTLAQNPYKKWD